MSTALRQCETRVCMPSLYQLISCSRRPWSIMQLRFSTSWSLNSEPGVQRCSYWLHNFHTQHTTVCECSLHFLSPPLRMQLQLIICNVCHTQMPFSQTTTVALYIRRPCAYVCNKHQYCYLSIFTLLSLLWNEKKIWCITLWATVVKVTSLGS
jgi:hypothetical protein